MNRKSALRGFFASVTDFQPVPARILEEHRIVARALVIVRSFDMTGPCAANDLSQSIDFRNAFSPKRNTAAVRLVQGRFGDSEKLRRPRRLDRFELQPTIDHHAAGKAQRG